MMAEASSGVDQGASGNELAASLDDYQILMPHAGDDNEDLCRLGQVSMNRHDYESKCFHGEGSVRDLCAGEYFTLSEHPEVDDHSPEDRDFVITALQVTAQNNLPKALAARVERLFTRSRWMAGAQELLMQRDVTERVATGPLRMHIQFTAVRRGVTIVPAYDARTDLPQAQMQSAIVVGPEGEEVHCDQLGRVKIRFPAPARKTTKKPPAQAHRTRKPIPHGYASPPTGPATAPAPSSNAAPSACRASAPKSWSPSSAATPTNPSSSASSTTRMGCQRPSAAPATCPATATSPASKAAKSTAAAPTSFNWMTQKARSARS
jgi:hypothetical protein